MVGITGFTHEHPPLTEALDLAKSSSSALPTPSGCGPCPSDWLRVLVQLVLGTGCTHDHLSGISGCAH